MIHLDSRSHCLLHGFVADAAVAASAVVDVDVVTGILVNLDDVLTTAAVEVKAWTDVSLDVILVDSSGDVISIQACATLLVNLAVVRILRVKYTQYG